MPMFDWRESAAEAEREDWGTEQWLALTARYETAAGAEGVHDWRTFVMDVRELAQAQPSLEWFARLGALLTGFIQALRQRPAPFVNTVFVSHQRYDAQWAEWVAWAATEAHLDYWLDIHDPALTRANATVLPPPVKSVLIAGIIEMALLNSTHIVSLQTCRARASRWVPYEFGRAKERQTLATNAASWFEPGITPDPNGDYLELAVCAYTSRDLKNWLDAAGRTPPPRPNKRWGTRSIPPSLPN